MAASLSNASIVIPHKPALMFIAKNLIKKHPGIYKGNLVYWIEDEVPEVSKEEIDFVFFQLIKEGYFVSLSKEVYPPNNFNIDEKTLMNFIYVSGLSDVDFGILYELDRCKRTLNTVNELSRIVLSNYWYDNEREIKIHIQNLVLENVIVFDNGLSVNWKLINWRNLNETNCD